LKRLDELVPRKLSEILITHGQSLLTDARLCENLLKDYCGEYKEEISLLVLGVKERIAIDLLVSQDAVEPEVLRGLLTTRLRRANSLNEAHAEWIVESWSKAIHSLPRADSSISDDRTHLTPAGAADQSGQNRPAQMTTRRQWKPGVVHQSEAAMRSVAFSPLDDTLAYGCDDGGVRLWDAATGQIRVLEQCAGSISVVRFSPNGVLLAFVTEASGKSQVRLWDLQAGEPLDLGEVGTRSPSLAFSPGGTRLACGSAERDGVIRVWNLQNGQTRILKGPWGGPSSISFSPDGELIAAADASLSNAAIRLWDLNAGAANVLGRSRRQISSVAFSPNGAGLLSGSWDETVCLWDVRTRKARILGKDCSCVSRVAFSLQGDKAAACSIDSQIRIWRLDDDSLRTIGQCDNVNDVGFSPDGTALATASSDGTIQIWNARV
jgi:WD40 repeat protein